MRALPPQLLRTPFYVHHKHVVNTFIINSIRFSKSISSFFKFKCSCYFVNPCLPGICRGCHTNIGTITKSNIGRLYIGPALGVKHPPFLFFRCCKPLQGRQRHHKWDPCKVVPVTCAFAGYPLVEHKLN